MINQRILPGFTLAELLIALGILGVLATFTIPKVLSAQQSGQKRAVTKEVASALSDAYSNLRYRGVASASLEGKDLTPYLNYVAIQSSSYWFDQTPAAGLSFQDCSNHMCIKLHSGALIYPGAGSFGGTETTRALHFLIDPDGRLSGNQDSIELFLYYNGRITTIDGILPNTATAGYSGWMPTTTGVPNWFSWN